MSTNLVRMKLAAVAAKIETVPGTDAIGGTPAAADWIGSEFEVGFDPTVIELPELTGSLDKAASVVGGLKPRIRLRMPLRGSGTAGTTRSATCCSAGSVRRCWVASAGSAARAAWGVSSASASCSAASRSARRWA